MVLAKGIILCIHTFYLLSSSECLNSGGFYIKTMIPNILIKQLSFSTQMFFFCFFLLSGQVTHLIWTQLSMLFICSRENVRGLAPDPAWAKDGCNTGLAKPHQRRCPTTGDVHESQTSSTQTLWCPEMGELCIDTAVISIWWNQNVQNVLN